MPKTVPPKKRRSNEVDDDLAPGVPLNLAKRKRGDPDKPNNGGEDAEAESSRPKRRPYRPEPDQRTNLETAGDAAPSADSPEPAAAAPSDFLLQALRRIQELQDEIEFLENDPYAEDTDSEGEASGLMMNYVTGHQAEALGFAVCARETMAFLRREGVPEDSPMMANLRERLVGRCERDVSSC